MTGFMTAFFEAFFAVSTAVVLIVGMSFVVGCGVILLATALFALVDGVTFNGREWRSPLRRWLRR